MHLDEAGLGASLQRLSPIERPAWLAEAKRLLKIVEAYHLIRQKRRLNLCTGKFEFVKEVLELCEQARCFDPLILRSEPHRARYDVPQNLSQCLKCKIAAAIHGGKHEQAAKNLQR